MTVASLHSEESAAVQLSFSRAGIWLGSCLDAALCMRRHCFIAGLASLMLSSTRLRTASTVGPPALQRPWRVRGARGRRCPATERTWGGMPTLATLWLNFGSTGDPKGRLQTAITS